MPTPKDAEDFWAVVTHDLDDLSARLILEIREELPSYHVLPEQEQLRTVRDLLGAMAEDLQQGEMPQPRTLQAIRASARRRAYYGMPVYDVFAAFHFAHRGLWETFRAAGSGTERLLVELVEPMAAWSQAMSQAVVDAYVDQQGGRDERERERCAQLFDLLADPRRSSATAEVLRELAYDPDGDFVVMVGRRRIWTRDATVALQRAGRRLTGIILVGSRSGLAVMLSQGMDIEQIVRAAQGIVGMAPLGVGLVRSGVDGIRDGLVDATRALRLAEEQGRSVVHFDEEWFLAMLADMTTDLAPLLAHPGKIAGEYPELADTVVAFAEAGFSLAGAGERLQLHPNSVSYRLGKWQERTGLDVRSFSDLARSLAAIAQAKARR